MKHHSLLGSSFAFLVGLFLVLGTAHAQPVLDKDYKMIANPQTPADPKKIEVIEFFSYACPHCAEFEPALQEWLKHKPKDVDFKEVPMVFRENWKPTAKGWRSWRKRDITPTLFRPCTIFCMLAVCPPAPHCMRCILAGKSATGN